MRKWFILPILTRLLHSLLPDMIKHSKSFGSLMPPQQTKRSCWHIRFHVNQVRTVWENQHKSFGFLMQMCPWMNYEYEGLCHSNWYEKMQLRDVNYHINTNMTWNEGQHHVQSYKMIQFRNVHYYNKSERNPSVTVWTLANVSILHQGNKLQKHTGTRSKLTENFEKQWTKNFFLPCNDESCWKSSRQVTKFAVQQYVSKAWTPNQSYKSPNPCNQ